MRSIRGGGGDAACNPPATSRLVVAAMVDGRQDAGAAVAPLLEVKDLVVSFGEGESRAAAVNGVSFSVSGGESLGFVGESGSGKSVTALSVMGLARGAKVSGSVRFRGREILGLAPRRLRSIRGREIAMVFQDPMSSLNPVQRIGIQISEVVETHSGVSRREGMKRAAELLELVGIPQARSHLGDLPHEFSGGMRQRVMIAMAVSCSPKLLIADEPTTALDVTTQAQVLALLRRLQQELEMAVIIITHDFGVIQEVAHRVNVMYGGRIVESGTLGRIIAEPWHPYTQGLLRSVPKLDTPRLERLGFVKGNPPSPFALPPGCAFADRCEHVLAVCRSSAPPERALSDGFSLCWLEQRPLGARFDAGPEQAKTPERRSRSAAKAAPLLVVDQLGVTYAAGGLRLGKARRQPVLAVDDVSFEVAEGETLGLVGESGSGKSTIGRAILQLVPITSGHITVGGRDVSQMRAKDLRTLAQSAKIVFQDPIASLDPRLTVTELVEEPMRIHGVSDRKGRLRRVLEVLDLVGLGSYFIGRYPHELSGGQRQRVGVARALVLSPKLIICDEPVSALDVSVQAQVVNLFHDLKDQLDLTYLFISHDLRVVRQLADRIAVIYGGQLLEVNTTDELFANPRQPYTQLLLASVPESPLKWRLKAFESVSESAPLGEIADEQTVGCAFASRCPFAQEICRTERPPLRTVASGAQVACHFWEEAALPAGRAEPVFQRASV
jgi:peptide/nickel transport system ATP-binding protein